MGALVFFLLIFAFSMPGDARVGKKRGGEETDGPPPKLQRQGQWPRENVQLPRASLEDFEAFLEDMGLGDALRRLDLGTPENAREFRRQICEKLDAEEKRFKEEVGKAQTVVQLLALFFKQDWLLGFGCDWLRHLSLLKTVASSEITWLQSLQTYYWNRREKNYHIYYALHCVYLTQGTLAGAFSPVLNQVAVCVDFCGKMGLSLNEIREGNAQIILSKLRAYWSRI
jgi:hypothetical protein